jgi:VanZ family protein
LKKIKLKIETRNIKLISNWLPVILWAAVIFYFSSLKQVKVSDFLIWDFVVKKVAHVTEYAILYALLYRATAKNFVVAYLVTILFAATDEFHQTFVLGRNGTPLDLGFDSSGANIATYLLWKLKQIRPGKAKKLQKNLRKP